MDIYCGDMNCYQVLGLERDAPKKDISKAYRKLAGKSHPDNFRSGIIIFLLHFNLLVGMKAGVAQVHIILIIKTGVITF